MRFAKNTQHDTSKVLRLPRKCNASSEIFWKRGKNFAPATQNHFWHVMKHVGMSQSATPATRNEAIRRLKCWNPDTFWRTCHRHGQSDLARTVADGCGQLRTVAQRLANTAQAPHPQSETGTLATHSGKYFNKHGKGLSSLGKGWEKIGKECCYPNVDCMARHLHHSEPGWCTTNKSASAWQFIAGAGIDLHLLWGHFRSLKFPNC